MPGGSQSNASEMVKANEIIGANLVRQLAEEIVAGYGMLHKQAVEVVEEAKGNKNDLADTIVKALEAIPEWNAAILAQETARITANKPMLPTLVAASAISATQVMFSIRPFEMDESQGEFDLQTPDPSIVIIESYKNLADELIPYIEEHGPHVPKRVLREVSSDAVNLAVQQTLPMNSILGYLFGSDLQRLIKRFKDKLSSETGGSKDDADEEDPVESADAVVTSDEAGVEDEDEDAEEEVAVDEEEDGEEEEEEEDDIVVGEDGASSEADVTTSQMPAAPQMVPASAAPIVPSGPAPVSEISSVAPSSVSSMPSSAATMARSRKRLVPRRAMTGRSFM